MIEIPTGMTYAAGGAALVTLSLLAFQSWLSRGKMRDKAEGTVDQRAAGLILVVTKPFQDLIAQQVAMLEKERAAKEKAENARDKAVQDLVQVMRDAAASTDTKILKATTRIHDRLDKCEKEHDGTKISLRSAMHRLEAMETRERETLRLTPSPSQQTITPILLQQAAPPTP